MRRDSSVPDPPIIARADGPDAVRELYALGIDEVTAPEVEAAIEMTRAALVHLGATADETVDVAKHDSAPAIRQQPDRAVVIADQATCYR